MGQNEESNWPKDWSTQIGRTLKELRGIAGLSAQAVSDRCGELGFPIPRSTIANIESGRKEAVPVHEISVLAMAIGVSPMALLFPIDKNMEVHPLPGKAVHPWTAWLWFSGFDIDGNQKEPLTEAARHMNGPLQFFRRVTEGAARWEQFQALRAMSAKIVRSPSGQISMATPTNAVSQGDLDAMGSYIDEMSAKTVKEIATYAAFLIDTDLELPPMPAALRSTLQAELDSQRQLGLDIQFPSDDSKE